FLTHLIAAREFPAKITGQKTPHACLKQLSETYGVPTVGMTLGPEGALLFEGGSFHYSPGFEVPVVDTTGAGDVFHGAFIYGILRGWPCRRRLDFANALAAMNCTALGARGAIRTREEAEALLPSGSRTDSVIYHSSPASLSR
ncbi:MAG: PfkB family carbohydrate kinase, partial [bacterium]